MSNLNPESSGIPGGRRKMAHRENIEIAADAADTLYVPIFVVDKARKFRAAKWLPDATQAVHGTNYRTLRVVNLGSDAGVTAVTVLATKALTTGTLTGFTAVALTNSTVSGALDLVAGDVVAFVTTKTANGIVVGAGRTQIELE